VTGQAEGGRRKAEGCAFPADPCLHQRAAAAAASLLGRDLHRKAVGGDAGDIDGDAAGREKGGVIILVREGDQLSIFLNSIRLIE
jgi:hypothetical protein